jgi:hypothetical protein
VGVTRKVGLEPMVTHLERVSKFSLATQFLRSVNSFTAGNKTVAGKSDSETDGPAPNSERNYRINQPREVASFVLGVPLL